MGDQTILETDQLHQLVEEPRIDAGELADPLQRPPELHGVPHVVEPPLAGDREFPHQQILGGRPCRLLAASGLQPAVVRVEPEPEPLDLHAPDRLLQRLLEGPTDRHALAHRLHLGGEGLVGLGELLEGPAGHLHHDVVDRRLETRRGGPGDVVAEFVEGVSHRQLRGDPRDRKSGGLRSERGTPGHPRIHLDHDHVAVRRVHRELDVRAAGVDPDRPHDRERTVPQPLVLLVGERHDRGDGDRVAGVHAHRIDVLDAADHHAVVLAIPDDLEFVFLPSEQRLVDLDLVDHRRLDAGADDLLVLLPVPRDAAAGAAERERGPDDRRQSDLVEELHRVLDVGDGPTLGVLQADGVDDLLERLAILGATDDLAVGADHLDAVLLQDPPVPQFAGAVQAGLSAERRKDRVDRRAEFGLPLDHLPDRVRRDRLDVGPVAERRVGHDRRGVRVHQDDPVSLLAEGLAGLGSRIVEFTALADDDRAGTEKQDRGDVVSSWHGGTRLPRFVTNPGHLVRSRIVRLRGPLARVPSEPDPRKSPTAYRSACDSRTGTTVHPPTA